MTKHSRRGIEKHHGAASEKLYELGIGDASFIGLDSTHIAANPKQNNPESFAKDKFKQEIYSKAPRYVPGVHSASSQHKCAGRFVSVSCLSGSPFTKAPGGLRLRGPSPASSHLSGSSYNAHIFSSSVPHSSSSCREPIMQIPPVSPSCRKAPSNVARFSTEADNSSSLRRQREA